MVLVAKTTRIGSQSPTTERVHGGRPLQCNHAMRINADRESGGNMIKIEKFETIEEFQVIWAEHVGRTETWWEEQQRRNDSQMVKIKELSAGQRAIENRVYGIIVLLSVLGQLAGYFLPRLIQP